MFHNIIRTRYPKPNTSSPKYFLVLLIDPDCTRAHSKSQKCFMEKVGNMREGRALRVRWPERQAVIRSRLQEEAPSRILVAVSGRHRLRALCSSWALESKHIHIFYRVTQQILKTSGWLSSGSSGSLWATTLAGKMMAHPKSKSMEGFYLLHVSPCSWFDTDYAHSV